MTIVFFGSSKYSTIVEEALYKNFGLTAAVTVSDKITGRDKKLNPSPVKYFATKNKVPAITSDKLTEGIIEKIAEYKPDFIVVADYGVLLPKKLLDLPKVAAINVHHSLLPKYRGPSPAPSAILNGDKISGVTVMMMSETLDTGDILAQKEYTLKKTETTDTLLTELNTLGADLVCGVIKKFDDYYKNRITQDNLKASYTSQMDKIDGYIDILNPPDKFTLDRMVRAYYPWPGVFTKMQINGGEKIVKFLPSSSRPELNPGLSQIIMQVEGKKAMAKKRLLKWLSKP